MSVKVYVVEVKVEVAWANEIFTKNLTLSTIQSFVVRPILLPRHDPKRVLSMGCIQDLLSLDF